MTLSRQDARRVLRFVVTLFSFALAWILNLPIALADHPSPEDLFKRLSALAPTGNADVQYNLGMFLNNGIGTNRDNHAAFQLFLQAAQGGNELAAYKVGCYYAGQFSGAVTPDSDQAFEFKLRAAKAGYDLAQTDIALVFIRKGDNAQAMTWLERASHQNNRSATALLAEYLASERSPDKVKGLGLMLALKDRMPNMPQEAQARITVLESQLSASEKAAAEQIRSAWFEGPSPLTRQARDGISAVPALLTSLEQ
jgi:hypothetical protein